MARRAHTEDLPPRVSRLEEQQAETNVRLGRIEGTLSTVSRVLELMEQRLEHLEEGQEALIDGHKALVKGQDALVEGQQRVIERLDRLIAATIDERTAGTARWADLARRVERLEERVLREER